jgi:DNA polymerase-3 subunit alpha
MSVPNFVHLNCHTEYSIIDGILQIKPLIEQVIKFGMHSVAITDQSNLFGAIKFYKAAIAKGVKPIIGCDIWVKSDSSISSNHLDRPENNHIYRLTLLCQNNLGLKNLMKLISKSYNNWQQDKPIVNINWLQQPDLNRGLIAIAPMWDSDIGSSIVANDLAMAKKLAKQWQELFEERFYIAVSLLNKPGEKLQLDQIVKQFGQEIPLIASGEVRFLEQQDFIAHEARVCINKGTRLKDEHRKKEYTEAQYLKSPEEISKSFNNYLELLINAEEIAKRCNVKFNLDETYLPNYKTPDASLDSDYLNRVAQQGLIDRLGISNYQQVPAAYQDRLQAELTVIINMGFTGYFLIVADIINWSLQNNIPVGPGRGSGAGSLVAYVLKITNIDPLQYGLLFERFLNPERVSMPDFDIDFCINGRDLVIDYVANKYGKSSVAQIITYGTMAAKAAIRDVGRSLGIPYGFVDHIAKLVPLELGITINQALQQEALLKDKYDEDDEVRAIIDLAIKLEGITRNVGKHAGGLVIAPQPIVNFSPLYYEANNVFPVTQFDKNDIEDIGLVKFDFLGLKTLTIIDLTVKSIQLDINQIPLDDQQTFEFLSAGNTMAVFQLESRGMRELVIKLQPNCFEDLIAIGALYRPGPLQSGMVDDFINRKRGKAKIKYPHPDLEPVLKSTYGVIVYQEQVMQIAQILAGYTLGAADLLRRAMGKKNPESMAQQREIFIRGVCDLDKNREQNLQLGQANAQNIFDLMDKFAGYGFNKSHAAGYALITYQTAWLKTHYPAEFMSAVMSLDVAHTDKIIMFIIDCKKIGITITSPNINTGEYNFIAADSNSIKYGLGAIKGMGESAISNIIAARASGPFTDLLDLCSRVDLHKVSRRTLEALIKSGALDCFNIHRAALLHYLEDVIKMAVKSQERNTQQLDLFAACDLSAFNTGFNFSNDICDKWSKQELLAAEKEALGFYFSDHPLAGLAKELQKLGVIKFNQATIVANKIQKFAGCIVGVRATRTKKGDKMAVITLDDSIVRQEVVVFSDLYQQHKELLKKDKIIIIAGEVSKDNYTGGLKIRCNQIINFQESCNSLVNDVTVVLNSENINPAIVAEKIKKIMLSYPGVCPVILHYKKSGSLTKIKFGPNWQVNPDNNLFKDLKNLQEIEDVYVNY